MMQLYEDDTHAHEYVEQLEKEEGSAFNKMCQECLRRYELPGKTAK